jgi:hypothetical protein
VILRIFLWNLADSRTSLGELRERLPELEGEGSWISNEANERFGLITFSDEAPRGLAVAHRDPTKPRIAVPTETLDEPKSDSVAIRTSHPVGRAGGSMRNVAASPNAGQHMQGV